MVVPMGKLLPDAGTETRLVTEQLSVAVTENGTVTPLGPAALTTMGAEHVMTGGMVSCTRIAWFSALWLPTPSVNVHVAVKSPCPNVDGELVIPVIFPLQLSVAVGGAGSAAEHWATTFGRVEASGTGAMVSCTWTAWVRVLLLLAESVKVHTISVSPCPNG